MQEFGSGSGKLVWVKVPAAKPDDPSSMPRAGERRELTLSLERHRAPHTMRVSVCRIRFAKTWSSSP